jgi:hypothetical protein
MLQKDPVKRVTASEALNFPFFVNQSTISSTILDKRTANSN